MGEGSSSDEGGASPSLQELIELGDPSATPEPWDDIVPQEDAQASDLMELVQLGEPPRRKFKNRSWEHAQHAVSGKKLKAAEDRATMAEAACKRMGKSLALVQHLYPRFKALLRKACPKRALWLHSQGHGDVADSVRAIHQGQGRSFLFSRTEAWLPWQIWPWGCSRVGSTSSSSHQPPTWMHRPDPLPSG